ncbi:MAG: hypothetical protein PHT99_00240 [Methanoregula sp.]|nr:hypothetical protein [Methanoregula sp.]
MASIIPMERAEPILNIHEGMMEPGYFFNGGVGEKFPGPGNPEILFIVSGKRFTNIFPAAGQNMQTRESLFLDPGTVWPGCDPLVGRTVFMRDKESY